MTNYLKAVVFIAALAVSHISFAQTMGYIGEAVPPTKEDLLKAQFEYGPFGSSEGWELSTERNNIRLYTRPVKITHIKACKGILEVDESFSNLIQLFYDQLNYTQWMHMVDEIEIIEELNETEHYVYTVNAYQWPASVRDAYTFRWWEQDPDTLVVQTKFISTPDYLPKKRKNIRVALLLGQWTFIPQKNGKVLLEYELIVEPGGWIPDFLVNLTVKYLPYILLNKVQNMLPIERYKGKSLSWLKLPSS